ncbi:MAG TPA: endo-1,4-beta-xylanase [Actinomycetota bacterium]|jgi:endo-1,4-beta-xylanase|nr:endo-1,4-beta-xylanase [Actinomycetota bacterium]
MRLDTAITRRGFLLAAAGSATAVLAACTRSTDDGTSSSAGPALAQAVLPSVSPGPVDCLTDADASAPLWKQALTNGLVYGSSAATWQLSDAQYRSLFEQEAGILFTEDDLLWWRLRPTPQSGLDFTFGDRIIDLANRNGMLVFGAHLVWDEGFGDGWTDDDLWSMSHEKATHLIHSTIDAVVSRYQGKVAAWSVVNEAIDTNGVRTNVPWYSTIGPDYIADAFTWAQAADPTALLVYNDYGYETDLGADTAADKRAATLDVLDGLLSQGVPVHALGIQAHLHAARFAERFDADAYRTFLSDVAQRGLKILITEMDVLDDGLPADQQKRDDAVASVYSTYLNAALQEPDIAALMTFGLSDRYTWLQEDYPRSDGAPRRPLPFDDKMQPTPALAAVQTSLRSAAQRTPFWVPPRCS